LDALLQFARSLTGRLGTAGRSFVAPLRWNALGGHAPATVLGAMLLSAFSVGTIAASASRGDAHSLTTDAIRPSRSDDDDDLASGLDPLDDGDDLVGAAGQANSSCVQGDSGSDSNGDGNTDSSALGDGGSGSDSNGDGNTDSSGGGGSHSGGGSDSSGGGESGSGGPGDSNSAGEVCPQQIKHTPTKTRTSTPVNTPTKTATRTPTKTPTKTNTPQATATRTATHSPKAIHTPKATHTPKPTHTPKATNTSQPTPTRTVASDVLPTVVGPTPNRCEGYPIGDVNGPKAKPGDERRINSIDSSIVLQYDAVLINRLNCPENADVNRDGRIDSRDALLILHYEAGFLFHLPVLAGASQYTLW